MSRPYLAIWVERQWRRNNVLTWLLTPLSWIYCGAVVLRKLAYAKGWRQTVRLPAPVIVVGNITVGGAGKTPFTLWLASALKSRGYRPGIISRGYRGEGGDEPVMVSAASDPLTVGDEPVLMARRAACPVSVCRDRVAAGRALLRNTDCDVILSDDGLQHLRLARDLECVIVDGGRMFGNKKCLPSGPLREKLNKLHEVDFVVVNAADAANNVKSQWTMRLVGNQLVALADGSREDLSQFKGKTVHAVAGIGNPQRFFQTLRASGLQLVEHAFPDHHPFSAQDLSFSDELPVIMTEKDAVKCEGFARDGWWSLPVTAQVDDGLAEKIIIGIKEL